MPSARQAPVRYTSTLSSPANPPASELLPRVASIVTVPSSLATTTSEGSTKTSEESAHVEGLYQDGASGDDGSGRGAGNGSEATVIDDLESDFVGPRRTGRKRKSNLVYINGQAVLAENNYVLKGHSYSFGAFEATATKKRAEDKNGTVKKKARGRHMKEPTAKSLVADAVERRRTAHNDAVRGRVVLKSIDRALFLSRNLEALAPFLSSKVQWRLRSCAAGHEGHPTVVSSDAAHEPFAQPNMIKGKMRDYQLIGLGWMHKMHRSNMGMILGDEMGLGKTLQTISLICHLKESEGITGPSLVICPLSVLYSWCNELTKWAPGLKFLRLHSSSREERDAQKAAFLTKATDYDIVVTTYDMVKNPVLTHLWRRTYFNYLVLDEGHKIKEHSTQISQAVRCIHRENSLILTGTPLQNNLVELWSLLSFLNSDVFIESKCFEEAFNIGNQNRVIDKKKLLLAHDLLDVFMLRRLKTEVEKLMPLKIETKIICPLSQTQLHWYKGLLLKNIKLLERAGDAENTRQKPPLAQLKNLFMQLRKCCLHPYLFDGAEDDIDNTTLIELIAASGKLAVLDKLLVSLFFKGHRVVLFSQFTRVLNILTDYCTMRGWNFCRFDGSTPRAKRNYVINRFNAPDSKNFIFLMSTRAGGIGLNLQTADTCILYDSDWNPQPDIQAMARVHRIGQKKTVHVYRLVCGGTIEERIIERAEKKLYLDQMVNRGSVIGQDKEDDKFLGSKLLAALKFGCNAVCGESSQNVLPNEDDIEAITDRSRTETFSMGKLKGGVTQTAEDFNVNLKSTASTQFKGVDFKKLRDEIQLKKEEDIPKDLRGIARGWAILRNKDKRKRKNRLIMVQGKGSGYGTALVPVLSLNNYALESGESSVFNRELDGDAGKFGEIKQNRQFSGRAFESQDFCQDCGDGGELLCCPYCPVCVHESCVDLNASGNASTKSCPHHRCTTCDKNTSAAGGLLFPCQSCTNSYCEDCLPTEDVSEIVECERFKKLGFDSKGKFIYIHCSKDCEDYAKKELDWNPYEEKKRFCPESIDVSYNFQEIDS